jgi:putative ABC transport system permease protein
MPLFVKARSFLRNLFSSGGVEADLDEEVHSHLEMLVEENIRAGMAPKEAQRAARIELGGIEQVKEQVREKRIGNWIHSVISDCRYGLRQLRKNPSFTAVAILTLALGIGANTALFSVVNSILLRPLPFSDSGQIVMLFAMDSRNQRNFVSFPDYADWQTQSSEFEQICAIVPQSVNLTKQGEPKRVIGGFVSANFFSMLGVAPGVGRDFRPGEDRAGVAGVAIVSYGLWQGTFGGDAALIGKTLVLNDAPFTVVGIMPRDFHFPWSEAQVWIPYRNYPNFTQQRERPSFAAIGRIRSGVPLSVAQAEMNTIAAGLAQQYPDTNGGRGIKLIPFHDIVVEDLRPQLLLLWGMVGLVLLIACANVAGLVLARASRRTHEINVRAAMGAARGRLFRQLWTEAILLWMIGGAMGTLFAYWGSAALSSRLPSELASSVRVDTTTLAFTLGISAITGLLFGLVPALGLSRVDLAVRLKEWGRSHTLGGREWLRQGLVILQIALALVLLAASGLLLHSLNRVIGVPLGFDKNNLLTLEYRVPRSKYPQDFQQWAFHRAVVEKVRGLPGVDSAAVLLALPFSGNGNVAPIVLLDRPAPARGQEPATLTQLGSAEAFSTLSIPLIRGSVFTDHDSADQPKVANINREMARRFWPDGDPLGRTVRLVQYDLTATIVGVVGDIKQFSLEDPEQLQIYLPYAQRPFIFATLLVKTQGEPLNLAKSVQQSVWAVDADQPVWKIRTLASLIDLSLGPRQLVASLLSGFAGLVLLLASMGIYGTLAYVVQQRTQEIGIRLALGGQPGDILKLILKQGGRLAVAGLAIGVAVSFALAPLVRSLLFDTSVRDPLAYLEASALLLSAALAACVLPARRAMRADPIVALRYE